VRFDFGLGIGVFGRPASHANPFEADHDCDPAPIIEFFGIGHPAQGADLASYVATPHLAAALDHHDSEPAVAVEQIMDHPSVPLLEDVEGYRGVGEDGVLERKHREFCHQGRLYLAYIDNYRYIDGCR
jgi:hypothetical protein